MTGPRSKLAVATTFPVFPPCGGGQARIFGLYSALARLGVEVEIVALVGRDERGGERRIAPGVREVRVPKTPKHDAAEYELVRRAGVPVTDLALALHHELTPAYGDALAAAASGAAAAVASHPFAQPALAACADAPLIYEAHNVELDLKVAMLAGSDAEAELSAAVRAVEGACCQQAAHVLVCAAGDGRRLTELYGLDPERIVVVPNGVDPAAVPYTPLAERRARRAALGLEAFHALFLGSWHEPNLVAVRDILRTAEALPDMHFLLVGSAGLAFADGPVPGNADLCGVVSGGFVRSVLGLADAALNPMRWGSGTNLKMLDYALAGVPVVSSEFGARGLDLEPDLHYLEAHPDDLESALRTLRDEPAEATEPRARAARAWVAERFAWSRIAATWHGDGRLRELLEGVGAPS